MCRKLGKGHPDYVSRTQNMYTLGEDGVSRVRRTHAGRPITKHHGTNVLNAYTDLRDKFWSWHPEQPGEIILKVSAKKAKRLARLERHTNHGMNRTWQARKMHLVRNNINMLAYYLAR